MKDKKKKRYLIAFGIFLFIIIFVNFILIFIPEEMNMDGLKKGEDYTNSVICTYTDKDDIHYKVELSFVDGLIEKKTEETSWDEKESTTCDFYTKRVEVYNSILGIQDSIECDNTKGVRVTVFDFENLDTREANIAELRYMQEDRTFDIHSYIIYKESKGYRCVKEQRNLLFL